jgi:hypothetical protein
MKLSNLFAVNAVLAGLFGLALVLVPSNFFELYGIEDPADTLLFTGRLLGGAFITFAVLTWQSREAQDSTARKAVVLALFVGFVVGFVVSLIGQLNDIVNALGWSTVAIYLLLAIAYGYFQFGLDERG